MLKQLKQSRPNPETVEKNPGVIGLSVPSSASRSLGLAEVSRRGWAEDRASMGRVEDQGIDRAATAVVDADVAVSLLDMAVADSSLVITLTDAEAPFRIHYVSETAGSLLGLEPSDILADPGLFAGRFAPEEAALRLEGLRTAAADGSASWICRMSDGRGGSLRLQESARRIGSAPGTAARIAVRSEVVAEAETSRSRTEASAIQLLAAIDNVPHGLAIYGADGRLVLCNRDFASLYGVEPEVMQGARRQRDRRAPRPDLQADP